VDPLVANGSRSPPSAETRVKYPRQYPRFPFELRVELAQGVGVTQNVSAGGVYFVTDQPHSPGEPADFTLVLGQLTDGGPWRLRCAGTVLRVEPRGDRVGVAATIVSYQVSS
jgi:PilZ domain-containing protein